MLSKIKRKIKQKWDKRNYLISLNFAISKMRANYEKLSQKKKLTAEQEKEIIEYFKELTGEDVPTIWHEYFYSRNGNYSKKYIPRWLYSTWILVKANRLSYRDAYADKNMIDIYLPKVNHPEIILKNMNGYFYINNRAVSKDEAVAHCQNLKDVIIKPSLLMKGTGFNKFSVTNGMTDIKGLTIERVFDWYGEDFIIQKFLHQHEKLAALNPTSINTIRILTYRSGMEIIPLYTVIRIGRQGQVVDNESAGGISTVIHPDGKLGKYAFGDPGVENIEKTDSGITLEGYEIPSYHKAVEMVKQLHLRLPFFNFLGWDVSIGVDGEPLLIEFNIKTELSQTVNGPAFGEYTERILKEVRQKKEYQSKDYDSFYEKKI